MNLNNDSRTRINVSMRTSIDPTAATLELKVDDTWHACEWTAAAEGSGTSWTRLGRTAGYFAGPAVESGDLDGATVLALGRHQTETRVKWTGGDTIVDTASPIDVRE